MKKQKFWSCEHENVLWQGSYKLSGKNNYMQEGMHRMETLYGESMSDYDLELLRCNRFFKMMKNGSAMSLDDVNESYNLWLKKCLNHGDLSENIKRSKYIASLRCCAYECFGYREKKSKRLEASKRVNVTKLRGLLERVELFQDPNNEREFDEDFFWSRVQMPKATGNEKHRAREAIGYW